MTEFERTLRREGRALGPKGAYLVKPYADGSEWYSAIMPDRAYELRTVHWDREEAILACLRDAGVSHE